MKIKCRECDSESDSCSIFQSDLTGEWYYLYETGARDVYDNDWIREKIYINYCPWCGKELK